MKFPAEFERITRMVDEAMDGYLCHDPAVPDILNEAIRYSLSGGGKRIRPLMVILSCQICGGKDIVALPAAVAMEMVHTYSLIHDDLPAMDDDDYRRGRLTNHKVFGEGIAILAGDALLTHAFNILAVHVKDDVLARRLVRELSEAAGAAGMIGGQVADISAENTNGDYESVKYIHIRKTAMMFQAAMRMGAICAEAEEQKIDVLGDFGLKMGLAFQIVDDLLDETATLEEMGKQTRKDHEAGKMTYPAILGKEESRRKANKLMGEAKKLLEPFLAKGELLKNLIDVLTARKN